MAAPRKPSATSSSKRAVPSRTKPEASAKPVKAARKPAAPRKTTSTKAVAKSATAKSALAKSSVKAKAERPVAKKIASKSDTHVDSARDAESKRLALAVAAAGLDKKAENIEIIDVIGIVDYTDYLVVMSGSSDRQLGAIANHVEAELKKIGTRCLATEGVSEGVWVLQDFGDVVVHLFHKDKRGYYDLETMFLQAKRVAVPRA